jgi:hypothetical protein
VRAHAKRACAHVLLSCLSLLTDSDPRGHSRLRMRWMS